MKLFGGSRVPEDVAGRVPPGQRLVKGWPVLHYGPIPRFDGTNWDFEVTGLVENAYVLTYAELQAVGPVKVTADMHCVTGWSTLDNEWEGVSFRVLAERAHPKHEANWVIAHCAGGYTSNLSLRAMDDDDVLESGKGVCQDFTHLMIATRSRPPTCCQLARGGPRRTCIPRPMS